jgi:hypothetical protein
LVKILYARQVNHGRSVLADKVADIVVLKPTAEGLTEIVPEIQIHENGTYVPVAL